MVKSIMKSVIITCIQSGYYYRPKFGSYNLEEGDKSTLRADNELAITYCGDLR